MTTPSPVDFKAAAASTRVILAVVNLGAGIALIVNLPGTSPSLQFVSAIVPLPVWGAALLVSGGLALAGTGHANTLTAGHTIAVLVWAMLAAGAVLGLLAGTTGSRSASGLLTVLLLGRAALHVNSMALWRKEARRRKGDVRGDDRPGPDPTGDPFRG